MFILQAPYPAITTTTYLPNPRQGDSIAMTGTLEIRRALDGTKYVYVKSRDSRRRLIWSFSISQAKALELQAFWEAYSGSKIKVIDHTGRLYLGYFTTNPFEFEAVGRSLNSPGNDTRHQIQIEFEGEDIGSLAP